MDKDIDLKEFMRNVYEAHGAAVSWQTERLWELIEAREQGEKIINPPTARILPFPKRKD